MQLQLSLMAISTGRVVTYQHIAAQDYIANIDIAISIISADKQNMVALMNRLDHAMANLSNMATDLFKGRIRRGFCRRVSELARTQVLQRGLNGDVGTSQRLETEHILALFN